MVRFSGNPDDLPGFEGQKRFKNFGDQWTNILDFVRRGSKNNHAKRKSRGILLMDQVSVDREESFKFSGYLAQQISILHTRQPGHGDSDGIMSGQFAGQPLGEAFVENEPHAGTGNSNSTLVSSKKVRTCAFFTVGKSSRNSSIV